ncbi:DUF397 domain-containing protein [Actinoallomurus oryzae]
MSDQWRKSSRSGNTGGQCVEVVTVQASRATDSELQVGRHYA